MDQTPIYITKVTWQNVENYSSKNPAGHTEILPEIPLKGGWAGGGPSPSALTLAAGSNLHPDTA